MEITQFQEIISKIDGVISVKIIPNNDEILEVHILANKLRAPKQIVRDIESSLIAMFDYRIDRKVISIAQIETNELKEINRIKYDGISINAAETSIECSVRLNYEDEIFEAELNRVRTVLNSRRVVAEAAIKAIEKIIGQTSAFDIQDVVITNGREISFVSVVVNMINHGQEEALVGSAIIRNDINESIVKATLDAVNRRVQKSTY